MIRSHCSFVNSYRFMLIASHNMVIAQIETKLGVEHAKQIAAVDGIDALLIGPNDLSISLGIPGEIMSQTECDAISKVADACESHGKLFSLHSSAKLCNKFRGRLNFITQGSDISMLSDALIKVRAYADENLQR
ncbi:aldolase/citrate lyase family protein [Yanshouia hominis]|uniref:aldolase/citrate lyase family protein n=1 Tax=Yanshouia hominis TaxID=2763673 RepID=UPI0021CC8E56|nr:aldolase/citrate lyase family protein [Yanshouia hominis]